MNVSAIPRLYPAQPDDDLPAGASDPSFGTLVEGALDAASSSLERADSAERAFAAGHGGLQEMVLARAQADVALAIASTTASRVTQALTTILGMQL